MSIFVVAPTYQNQTYKQGVYVIDNYQGVAAEAVYGTPIVPRINFQTRVPSLVDEVNQVITS